MCSLSILTIAKHIEHYLESLSDSKQLEMQALHALFLKWMPETKLWFESGKDDNNKTVSNPVIGYGSYLHQYAKGEIKELFQIGISANSTGISIYFMGLKDKTFLKAKYGDTIGKASITGYCIKFKKLVDIDTIVLKDLVKGFLDL